MVATNIIEVKNLEVVVLTLFLGFLFILIILLVIVIIYYCIKKNRPKGPKIAPAALVAAVIGRVRVNTVSGQSIFFHCCTYRTNRRMKNI